MSWKSILGYLLSDQLGSFMLENLSKALSRNSSIQSGSSFRVDMRRIVSVESPLGIEKESMSRLKPNFLS